MQQEIERVKEGQAKNVFARIDRAPEEKMAHEMSRSFIESALRSRAHGAGEVRTTSANANGPQAPRNREAVDFRHHDVEYDRTVVAYGREAETRIAGMRAIDHATGFA